MAASIAVFYALGGRGRSVAPSDKIGLGAFARLRHSLPAPSEKVHSRAVVSYSTLAGLDFNPVSLLFRHQTLPMLATPQCSGGITHGDVYCWQ